MLWRWTRPECCRAQPRAQFNLALDPDMTGDYQDETLLKDARKVAHFCSHREERSDEATWCPIAAAPSLWVASLRSQ
jgi:hypothetical protein